MGSTQRARRTQRTQRKTKQDTKAKYPASFFLCALCALCVLCVSSSRAAPELANDSSDFVVQPYYLVPADQEAFPEYEAAIRKLVVEIQDWYEARSGLRFRCAELSVVRAEDDYLTMRCGTDPAERERGKEDRQHMPNWLGAVDRAVGGFQPHRIAWVFAQGGGGWAGGNLFGDFQGFAIFGDWVLEPIAGKPNPAGITAASATWQVQGGVPKGTTAHELGHAFGLHHPDGYEGKTIMAWHGDYPDTDFLAHEKLILATSPWFGQSTGATPRDPDTPHVDFGTADAALWGQPLTVPGADFAPGDVVEFVDATGAHRVEPTTCRPEELVVTVPRDLGPGYVRVVRGDRHSNAVAINVYEHTPR